MGVHPWPGIDPATAYLTMTGGAGAAPMHAASAALSTLGGSTDSVVASSGVNTTATAGVWTGQGQMAAAASVTTLNTDDSLYAQTSVLKAQLLAAAGELHTMTVPQMVTHVQANANRFEYVVDNGINPSVFGALTPRLIALDAEYFGFMWPNNARSGVTFGVGLDSIGVALAGLSALPSLAGGSVAAPAMAAADVSANAGITMASAAMSTTEQAATTLISPATSALQSGSGLLGQEPLSAPATSPGTPTVSPMANVSTHGPAAPSTAQAQTPAMGMFLPPSSAAVNAPVPAPPAQTLSPVTGSPGAVSPGVTSFVKPAEPFKAPPMPSGGQATGLSPGMLNAAALRGPVSTAPASTAVLTQPMTTSSLATTTAQPLAYVPPQPPLPPAPLTPPQPPLLSPGDTAQSLTPPPQPQYSPPPPHTPPQPPQQQQPPPQPQPQAPLQPEPQPNPSVGAAPNQGVHNLIGDVKDSPGAKALSVQNNADVHNIVDPLPPGEHKGVKVLPTPQQIGDLYNQLTQNATPLPPGTYGQGLGKWALLPDGTRIGYRPTSEWGGPTVEIWDPGDRVPSVSVHLPEKPTPEPQPAPKPAPQPHPVQTPATQTPAPETHEPAHDDSGHPSIHVDPPPPGVWATIVGILGVIGGVIGGIGEFAR
jgi:hypothetical protein